MTHAHHQNAAAPLDFVRGGPRRLARRLAIGPLASFLGRLRAWRGVLSLAYHRVGHAAGSPFDRGLWSATPEVFRAQLRHLKRHFDVVGPADLAEVVRKARGRYVLITFDDGYRDNYEQAFPILRTEGLGATFFVTTGFVDRPRLPWWDEVAWMVRTSGREGLPAGEWLDAPVAFDPPRREKAIRTLLARYKQLPGESTAAYMDFLAGATGSGRCRDADAAVDSMWMTWDMLREMKAGGMWVGGHTVNHPVLARLDRDRQGQEITGCAARLREELGEPMRWFSYPVGGPDAFNDDTRRCLRDVGVEVAFSYYGGYRQFDDWDWHDVRRVAVETDVTDADFRGMLALPQAFARPLKRRAASSGPLS